MWLFDRTPKRKENKYRSCRPDLVGRFYTREQIPQPFHFIPSLVWPLASWSTIQPTYPEGKTVEEETGRKRPQDTCQLHIKAVFQKLPYSS